MKKTKIVATISDLRCSPEFIEELYRNGMNVVRINSAHQSIEGSRTIVETVRAVSDRIAIMIDTKGPEIRTTDFSEPFQAEKGTMVRICGGEEIPGSIPVNYPDIAYDVPVGSRILIDDGAVALSVVERDGLELVCMVLNSGLIKGRKSINVPNVHIDLPALSDRDRKFLDFAMAENLDFIAHSFVRSRADVDAVQEILDSRRSPIKIIAKIENRSGVENIDSILDTAYGVMVARGDLAIEIPFETVPGIQKMLVRKCIQRGKPVIIATQMLHSMIEEPRPTRAEVNDVANAIYDRADAMMLSGETAIGKYPVEAVKAMAAIAHEVERVNGPIHDLPVQEKNSEISAFLIRSAVEASAELDVKAIIADTTSGRSIRVISAYRGNRCVYAQCYQRETVRHLALSYGVIARYMDPGKLSRDFVGDALSQLMEKGKFQPEDRVVVVAGNFGRSKGVSFIEIGSVENLINGVKS